MASIIRGSIDVEITLLEFTIGDLQARYFGRMLILMGHTVDYMPGTVGWGHFVQANRHKISDSDEVGFRSKDKMLKELWAGIQRAEKSIQLLRAEAAGEIVAKIAGRLSATAAPTQTRSDWSELTAEYCEFLKSRERDIGFSSCWRAFRIQSESVKSMDESSRGRAEAAMKKKHSNLWSESRRSFPG